MKHALSSFALSLGLLLPVLAACSGNTAEDPATDGDGSDPTASVDAEVKAGRKKSCAAVGGACVGLSPSSCTGGHFADAAKVSCGGGVGVACCVACPVLSPPAPGFCPTGTVVPRTDPDGCATGFDCVPPPYTCPELVQPPPGFCPGGSIVPRKDDRGCTVGFDCVSAPSNACVSGGGTCVGLAPSSCPSGHWGDASTHSCGTGVGVGCCLP